MIERLVEGVCELKHPTHISPSHIGHVPIVEIGRLDFLKYVASLRLRLGFGPSILVVRVQVRIGLRLAWELGLGLGKSRVRAGPNLKWS